MTGPMCQDMDLDLMGPTCVEGTSGKRPNASGAEHTQLPSELYEPHVVESK